MSIPSMPTYNGIEVIHSPVADDLCFKARVYTLALIAFWALAGLGCSAFGGNRLAIADERWGASVILDEKGEPVSIYVEGPPHGAEVSPDGWQVEPGRTRDGRPYLLLERRP